MSSRVTSLLPDDLKLCFHLKSSSICITSDPWSWYTMHMRAEAMVQKQPVGEKQGISRDAHVFSKSTLLVKLSLER